MRLRLYESAITSRSVFLRKICSPATFEFCNKIGPERRKAVSTPMSAIGVSTGLVLLTRSLVESDPSPSCQADDNGPGSACAISSSSYHRVSNHPENERDRNMSEVAIEDAPPDDQCRAHTDQKQFCGSSDRMTDRLGENTVGRNRPWCHRANRLGRLLFLRRF